MSAARSPGNITGAPDRGRRVTGDRRVGEGVDLLEHVRERLGKPVVELLSAPPRRSLGLHTWHIGVPCESFGERNETHTAMLCNCLESRLEVVTGDRMLP
jgi:hypothetical protein